MFPNTQTRTDRVGSPYDSGDPLTTPPQLKRKPVTADPAAAAKPPAVAAGTAAGQAVRSSFQRGVNNAISDVNAVNRVGAAVGNTLTAAPRYAGGFVRDFGNALVGNAPSPNAGQPLAGMTAPQIAQIDFSKPAAAATAASAATANPATKPIGIASTATPLFDQNAAQLRFRGAAPLIPPDPPAAAGPSGAGASAPPGIDSGVTLPDGRKLNYGAMVNGVPTFSDGSGGPGGIPATMSKQDIASLGDRLNTVPASSFTRAGAGVTADAAGLSPLSSAGAVNTLVRNAQGPKFGITPEMLAQSDNNAVATGDWRSAAGTAAHNLAVEAAAPSTYLQRTRALTDLSNFQANTAKAGQAAVDNAATLQRTGIAGQNALDVADLQGQYGLADTRAKALVDLANRKPDQVTLADGTLGLIQPGGTVTRAIGADGKPVQVPMTKNGAMTEAEVQTAAQKLLPQVLGVDPTTGLIMDPNNPNSPGRQPTTAELQEGLRRARALVQGQSPTAATTKPTLDQFLTAARARNPGKSDADLKAYYNKTYGG